ncbi:MAG: YHYH protein [Leptospira sp.]|nr:YHYH protein [Leptospira sp.]
MKIITLTTLLIGTLLLNCASKKKDDSSTMAILAALLSSSSSGYSTTCTTTFGTGVPDWIKNSFTCVTVSVSGSNYVFKTNSLPTYKSVYWGSSSAGYETTMYSNSTGSNKANPNLIKSQNITITVPGDNTSTSAPSTGYGAIGVATNGIVLYNDQAAPGDSLSTEYYTFDSSQGHPTNTGAYHYHVEPPKISVSDSKLVGIALDGYLIFGKLHDTTTATVTNFSLGGSSSSTQCSTTGLTTAVPTSWSQATNYNSLKTSGSARHYHVNNGSEVNGIILSGKYIGTAGTSQ